MKRLMIPIMLLTLLLVMGFSAGPAFAEEEGNLECQYLKGTNINYQNYTVWSTPVYSYLCETEDGYMRVQGNVSDAGVTVVYYDQNFKVVSRMELDEELPLFGGFYASAENYYIVTGQKNPSDSSDLEVFRITQYDKNWKRINASSLYGANTYYPFDGGSCRMEMYGKYLIVRTAHEMFKSSDGLHHQSCYTLIVDTSKMGESGAAKGSTYGYTSHSFNQFITIDGDTIYTADHGDAYPRGINIIEGSIGESDGFCSLRNQGETMIMEFPGETGQNVTGASIGAMQLSSSNILVAGNSVVQDESNTTRKTRNIFVTATDRTTKETTTRWITDYEEGDTTVSTPHMVKIGDDEYMLLWSRGEEIFYARINGEGELASEIQTMTGSLSDCVPIVSDGALVWYTWKNGAETFYRIPLTGTADPQVLEFTYGHDYQWQGTTEDGIATLKCSKCGDVQTGKVPTGFSLWWSNPRTGNYYYPYYSMRVGIDEYAQYMTSDLTYSAESDNTYAEIVAEADDPENCIVNGRTITFKKKGTYVITVYPLYNPTLKKTCTINVVDPVTAVTASIDEESSAMTIGGKVRIEAETEGGIGSISYTFHVRDDAGEEVFSQTKSTSSTTNTCEWVPEKAGTYQITVDAVDSTAEETTITSNTLTVKIHDYQWEKTEDGIATLKCAECGETITAKVPTGFTIYWKDAAVSGSYYSYVPSGLEAGDAAEYWITSTRPNDVDSRFSEISVKADDPENCQIDTDSSKITFLQAGVYKITVYPKYNPDAGRTYTFRIVKPLESVSLAADPDTSFAENDVTLTATADGGKGSLTYRFVSIDAEGTETEIRAASTRNYCTWTPDKPGEYKLRVDVTDPGDNNQQMSSEVLSYTVKAIETVVKDSKEVTAAGELTYGQTLNELKVNNAVFTGRGKTTALDGSFLFENGDQILEAGTHTVQWTFTPADTKYAELTGTLSVTVNKAVPVISQAPAAQSAIYHPKRTLGELPLIGGTASVEGSWSWGDPDMIPTVPGGAYECVFVPDDSKNYEEARGETTLEITKAVPVITSVEASAITYGQSLASAELSGKAQYSADDPTEVTGTFQWEDQTILPAVKDSDTTQYNVIFHPEDGTDYEDVTLTATLPVEKADHPGIMPSQTYRPANSVEKLTNDILSDAPGWTFSDQDIGTALTAGESAEFTAEYVGEDRENYQNVTAVVMVIRSTCDHPEYELRNQKDATCKEPGYTGDKYCLSCGEMIESGQEIPMSQEHTWDEGTVKKEPTMTETGEKVYTCLVCGKTRTEVLEQVTGEGIDGTAFGPGAFLEATDQAIIEMTSDDDPAGTVFGLLQAKSVKQTKTSVTVTWKKVSGAQSYVIYANKCGKTNKLQKQKVVSGKTAKFTTIVSNDQQTIKVKKGTYYKFMIVAVDENNKVVSSSKVIHAATKGGKIGNHKKVTTKAKKNKVSLKTGKSFKLAAKAVPVSKKLKVKQHRKIAYESSNPEIAAVNAKGVIKGATQGSCIVYAYAQNGVMAKIKVTVK